MFFPFVKESLYFKPEQRTIGKPLKMLSSVNSGLKFEDITSLKNVSQKIFIISNLDFHFEGEYFVAT